MFCTANCSSTVIPMLTPIMRPMQFEPKKHCAKQKYTAEFKTPQKNNAEKAESEKPIFDDDMIKRTDETDRKAPIIRNKNFKFFALFDALKRYEKAKNPIAEKNIPTEYMIVTAAEPKISPVLSLTVNSIN